MTADQVRRSGTDPPFIDAGLERFADTLIAGKAQIVIAAEVQQTPAIHAELASLWRRHNTASPIHLLALQIVKLILYLVESGHIILQANESLARFF
jgi:hypothetical protein